MIEAQRKRGDPQVAWEREAQANMARPLDHRFATPRGKLEGEVPELVSTSDRRTLLNTCTKVG